MAMGSIILLFHSRKARSPIIEASKRIDGLLGGGSLTEACADVLLEWMLCVAGKPPPNAYHRNGITLIRQ